MSCLSFWNCGQDGGGGWIFIRPITTHYALLKWFYRGVLIVFVVPSRTWISRCGLNRPEGTPAWEVWRGVPPQNPPGDPCTRSAGDGNPFVTSTGLLPHIWFEIVLRYWETNGYRFSTECYRPISLLHLEMKLFEILLKTVKAFE